jgi:hypothetical protein
MIVGQISCFLTARKVGLFSVGLRLFSKVGGREFNLNTKIIYQSKGQSNVLKI